MRVWVLALVVPAACRVYFPVPSYGEKCMHEDAPSKQVILVKYAQYDNPGVSCSIDFRDKSGRVLKKHPATEASGVQGQAAYMTESAGEVAICVKCSGSRWAGDEPIKWVVTAEVGGGYMSDFDLVDKDHVTSLVGEIQRLVARTVGIYSENEYEKKQEMKAKDARDRLASNIVFLSCTGILGMLAVAAFQTITLRNYFKLIA